MVLDYGVGNLASVSNMILRAGGDSCVSRDPKVILAADKLVLPGVGHFDHGMKMLHASGLRDVIDRYALDLGRPVLGICLGSQILGRGSEEGNSAGLGWIDMVCRKLPAVPGIRVPQMGWNQISPVKQSPLIDELDDTARFYFVHSFYMECERRRDVLATTKHGIEFTCAVEKGNVMGVQFHPEKSLRHGLALMKSFVQWQRA